jgi:hypothetical protein
MPRSSSVGCQQIPKPQRAAILLQHKVRSFPESVPSANPASLPAYDTPANSVPKPQKAILILLNHHIELLRHNHLPPRNTDRLVWDDRLHQRSSPKPSPTTAHTTPQSSASTTSNADYHSQTSNLLTPIGNPPETADNAPMAPPT